jgi:hypothetical protein
MHDNRCRCGLPPPSDRASGACAGNLNADWHRCRRHQPRYRADGRNRRAQLVQAADHDRCFVMASILRKPSRGVKSYRSTCPPSGAHSKRGSNATPIHDNEMIDTSQSLQSLQSQFDLACRAERANGRSRGRMGPTTFPAAVPTGSRPPGLAPVAGTMRPATRPFLTPLWRHSRPAGV